MRWPHWWDTTWFAPRWCRMVSRATVWRRGSRTSRRGNGRCLVKPVRLRAQHRIRPQPDGPSRVYSARQAGRAMSPEQAIAYATSTAEHVSDAAGDYARSLASRFSCAVCWRGLGQRDAVGPRPPTSNWWSPSQVSDGPLRTDSYWRRSRCPGAGSGLRLGRA